MVKQLQIAVHINSRAEETQSHYDTYTKLDVQKQETNPDHK